MAKSHRPPRQTKIPQSEPQPRFPVVGIGASAGGFEAFKEVLENLPAKPGLAFVLVQHLDPSYASQLTELLAHVSPFPVSEVKTGRPVELNHLYVIPPNTSLTIAKGRLWLTPRRVTHTPSLPIDTFLQSLAADCGRRAIGVILSGNASDGVLGLKAIKAAGGTTLAQTVTTAKYDGMPRAAVAGGCVDFVLSPAKIAHELLRLARAPLTEPPAVVDDDTATDQAGWHELFKILEKATGVDFSYYKPPTLRRRVARRLARYKLATIADYIAHLKQQPAEVLALYDDILINVTNFFRDPPVFDALQKSVFPKLVAHGTADNPIRIWVPGCATGEEVYSLAISLVEFLEAQKLTIPIQIFGSDISEPSLLKARAGVYPASITTDVSANRLRRFFQPTNSGYEVIKPIREMCVFAKQNLIQDPPFSRLDLVSCRNVLIYLGPVLQSKVLPIFHYALKPTGHLLLGTSETITGFLDLFTAVNRQQRIYVKKPGSSRFALDFVYHKHGAGRAAPVAAPAPGEPDWTGTQIQKEADRLLVARYTPPSVLITENLEIVQFRGHTGPYLEPASGRASLNLLKMAREELVVDLRNAIQQAQRRKTTVRKEGLHLTTAGHAITVNIEVVPVTAPATRARHFLVLFETGAAVPTRAASLPVTADRRAAELAAELRSTKEYLQSVIVEGEGANEELKAANEEVRSSNEELQCTNEELETAKEELQSTNEELTTVNEELQTRNRELGQLNNDVNNLLTSTQIPIVMLGADLRIRRFTPTAEKALNLIATDVGRPISDLKLTVDMPDLKQLVAEAIDTLSVKELEVQDRQGRWYALRIRPYRTSDNKIEGAVVALMDIDEVKRSLTVAREARDFAEAIIETVRDPLLVLTADRRVVAANHAFCETFHVTKTATVGQHIYELGNRQWASPRLRKLLDEVLTKDAIFQDYLVEQEFPEIGHRSLLLNARPLHREGQRAPLILLAIEDITAQKQAAATQARLAAIVESSDDAITAIDLAGTIINWNTGAERVYGYTAAEAIGQPVSLVLPPDRAAEFTRLRHQLRRGKKIVAFETARIRKDGQRRDVSLTISPILSAAGKIIGSSGVARDITARKQAEAALRDSEERFRALFEQAQDGILLADAATQRFLLANPQIQKQLGYPADELFQLAVPDIHPAADRPRILTLFEKMSRGEITTGHNLPVRCKDGTLFYADISAARITLQGRRCVLGTFRDITQRKQLELEIQNISEVEKQRLGRDLHDGLSQQLTAVRYLAGALEKSLVKQALPEAGDAAKIVRELATAATQTYDLARGLFPVELQRGGIGLALEQLAATAASLFKISCQVVAPHTIHLEADAARQLYRIAQEAITNAAKHSHGQLIKIRLADQRGRLVLTVQDDGVGIPKKIPTHAGMGLNIMQYRANILNADLTIARTPTGGTLVTCAFAPLPPPPRA